MIISDSVPKWNWNLLNV